jgi:hypothetical protein
MKGLPIGEAQTALLALKNARALSVSSGWLDGLKAHLCVKRDALAARVLDDDSMSHEQRESLRIEYKAIRDVIAWPESTISAQTRVIGDSGDELGDVDDG